MDLLKRASTADLTAADLNYPDHFIDVSLKDLKQTFDETGISLNGLAMRYYSKPGFKLGAFTHPDASIRRLAIDETKKGIDTLTSLGGNIMTLWMGQDGVDYSFQGNYAAMWDWSIPVSYTHLTLPTKA